MFISSASMDFLTMTAPIVDGPDGKEKVEKLRL